LFAYTSALTIDGVMSDALENPMPCSGSSDEHGDSKLPEGGTDEAILDLGFGKTARAATGPSKKGA